VLVLLVEAKTRVIIDIIIITDTTITVLVMSKLITLMVIKARQAPVLMAMAILTMI
jgi:hypothetical protein